jgi:hypothetical protein
MTRDPDVERLLAGSTHPMTPGVERLRAALLDSDEGMSEHVKWKAPSFRYDGEDRVTFNLARPDRVVLVFHRGVRVRPDAERFTFDDPTGLLTWPAPDRGVLTFTDAAQLDAAVPAVVDLVGRWVRS